MNIKRRNFDLKMGIFGAVKGAVHQNMAGYVCESEQRLRNWKESIYWQFETGFYVKNCSCAPVYSMEEYPQAKVQENFKNVFSRQVLIFGLSNLHHRVRRVHIAYPSPFIQM